MYSTIKCTFFKELIQSLGYTQDDTGRGVLALTQEMLVRRELKNARKSPECLLNWNEERRKIDWNAC
jgi:hypothetical protein